MMKAWQIRENFELIDRIAISRRAFEELFTHTKERIEFTFNGWVLQRRKPGGPRLPQQPSRL